jgi:hypothetical protein
VGVVSLDLDAIKARTEAATPGPWFSERCGDFDDPSFVIAAVVRDRYGDNALNCGSDEPLAVFLAAARTDVLELVAEIERLRQQVAVLTAKLESAERMRETSRLRSERLVAEVERLRADLRIADEATLALLPLAADESRRRRVDL